MIAPLRNNKIVLYDIIYASFSGFIFILLSSRSLEHKNSNEKGGWNGYENKGYKEPERCNLARIDNQGNWQHWTTKTRDRDENEISNLVRTTRFWINLRLVRSRSKDCKAKYSFWSNTTKVSIHDSQNRLPSHNTTAKN
jgi:hypothetical protein